MTVKIPKRPLVELARRPPDPARERKRTIKFLAQSKNPKVNKLILAGASDRIIKDILNIAYNLHRNPEVKLNSKQKSVFKPFRKVFEKLSDLHMPLPQKRRILTKQKGGALPLLPILLKAGLPLLTSGILGKLFDSFGSEERDN